MYRVGEECVIRGDLERAKFSPWMKKTFRIAPKQILSAFISGKGSREGDGVIPGEPQGPLSPGPALLSSLMEYGEGKAGVLGLATRKSTQEK